MLVKQDGRVSVWVGRLADEDALRTYVEVGHVGDEASCPFWSDIGVDWFDEDFLEAEFHPNGITADQAVFGHSWWKSFAAPVPAVLADRPPVDANAVIVLYDADYQGTPAEPVGPVVFVNSFDYRKS